MATERHLPILLPKIRTEIESGYKIHKNAFVQHQSESSPPCGKIEVAPRRSTQKMIQVSAGKSIFVVILLGVLHCEKVLCFTQDDLSYIANNLNVHYEVLDNFESKDTYKSRLKMTNIGKKEIKHGPWAVYFNFIRLVEPKHLMANPSGYIIQKIRMKFVHISGSLFKLEPLKGFQTLSAGKSLSFDFDAQYYSVARTDVMPNWYVAAEGLQAMNVEKTAGEDLDFVGRFDTKKKWKRSKDDRYDPFTPAKRFEQNKVKNKRPNPGSIIPKPVEIKVENGLYVNVSNWTIVAPAEYEKEATYLGQKLNLFVINVVNASEIGTKILRLVQRDLEVKIDGQFSNSMEKYAVVVNGNGITISAPESSGIFYGIQSLLAVTDIKRKQVLVVSLKDAPRFEYRGLMLDISRNFHGKTSIMKILNIMARYKLNKLHLHLTDDEGWRLQIPGLEELTTLGSRRCHDIQVCLAPQIGSGAKTDTSGSGSLSVGDYRDILRHAKTLHIEIIPEFDMPGHSHAAIKAMEYRFKKYNTSDNETVASKFLLAEPDDPSQYFSVQMFRDNAVNPCLNSTYSFIEHVLSALVDLHKDISPLKLFHMGGDEVAHGAWINSTACKNFMAQNKDIDSLKKYFATRLSEIVSKYNISFAAWEDGLIEKNVLFNKKELSRGNVYSYAWDNVWEWGAFDRAYRFANAGYKTVLGHATHLYFDMPHEPDPEERGYYWATRYTDTKKTFGYMPDSVYDNAKEDRFGNPLTKDELCKKQNSCPPLSKKTNIVGIQGHLWSETVRDEKQLFYMCFPRVLALAERAWHKAEFEKDEESREQMFEKEWQDFANLLGYQELRKLDELGVNYRVPLPGAKIQSGKLVATSAFPGLRIEYSISGEWKEYTSPVPKLSGNVKLRTRSADGKRSSREINVPVSHGSRNVNPGAFLYLVMIFVILFYNYSYVKLD